MKISKEEVQRVVNKIFGNAKVNNITDLSGRINFVYNVGISNPTKSLILKLNAFPQYDWRLEKEKYVTRLITEHTDVPVPTIYLVDNTKDTFSTQYSLMSKIDGVDLESLLPNIDKSRKNELMEKAGECLGKMNSIKFNRFGSIRGDSVVDGEENLEEHYRKFSEKTFSRISGMEEAKGLIDNAKDFIERNIKLMQIPAEPCLIHYDYRPENIMIKNGELSGILDFEACRSSHNELDFVQVEETIFTPYPELEKPFLNGYQKHSSISPSPEFEKRQKLYQLQFYLSLVFFERDPTLKRKYAKIAEKILSSDKNGF